MTKESNSVLVLGGAGFIGRNLVNFLLSKGHRVCIVDNLYSSGDHNSKWVEYHNHNLFNFFNVDISRIDPQFIYGLIGSYNINRIYHLACPASPVFYQHNPIFTLKTCFDGTYNVLNSLIGKYDTRVLFTSTSEIYGDPDRSPQYEEYNGNVNTYGPRSCYDEGKRVAESICYSYAGLGIDVRIARIFNTYGPYMNINDGRFIPNLVKSYLGKSKYGIYGSGLQTRSFCYVDDTVLGLYSIMECKNISDLTPIYNVGNPEEITIFDAVDKFSDIFDYKPGVLYHSPLADDPRQRKPDISKIKDSIGWEPSVSFNEGLRKLKSWVDSTGFSFEEMSL